MEYTIEDLITFITINDKEGIIDCLRHLMIPRDIEVPIYCEEGAIPPDYAGPLEAGCDIKCIKVEELDKAWICHTGIHVAIPHDYVGLILPKSRLAKTPYYIPNVPGIIDETYRGEIQVRFRRTSELNADSFPKVGQEVAQLIIIRRPKIKWDLVKSVEDLGATYRGEGRYGSTGD